MELSLESIVLRSGLLPKNRSLIRYIIKNGLIHINKKRIINPFVIVKPLQVIRLDTIFWYNIRRKLKVIKRLPPL